MMVLRKIVQNSFLSFFLIALIPFECLAAVRVTQVQPNTVDLQLNRPLTVRVTGTDLHLARAVEVYRGSQRITAITGVLRANPTQGQIILTQKTAVAPGTYQVRLSDGRRPLATVPMKVVVRTAAPAKTPSQPRVAAPMQQAPIENPAPTIAQKQATTAVPARPAPQVRQPIALTDIRTIQQAPQALRGRLSALQTQKGANAVYLGRISSPAIRATGVGQTVRFRVAPNIAFSARAIAVEPTNTGRLLWRGEVPGNADLPPGLATLVVKGEDVTGSIRSPDGRLFRLRPLGGGATAIIEMNYNTMPPDHPPERRDGGKVRLQDVQRSQSPIRQAQRLTAQPRVTRPNLQQQPQRAIRVNPEVEQLLRESGPLVTLSERHQRWRSLIRDLRNAVSPIDVLVVYTESAENASGDIVSLIELAVAETNESFMNSNIMARIRLVGTEKVDYEEQGYSTMVEHLQGSTDGYMDTVHDRRDALGADVVILVVAKRGYCGVAYDLNVDASEAFAIVQDNCATGYYTFAHEIGHLMGAGHERTTHTNSHYDYGHGYYRSVGSVGPTSVWRTIMAYKCGMDSCPRLQYWSSPLNNHDGNAMGTSDHEDNARIWRERATTVARFRAAPPS